MGRERKKKKGEQQEQQEELNPEAEERKRLKKLAYSNNILSEAPANGFNPLTPSKTVVKHHGTDILKKSQRKNRYLFSFSGLLAPISGGKIGELTDLGSKNPVLYLDFPQVVSLFCVIDLICSLGFVLLIVGIGKWVHFGVFVIGFLNLI